MQQQELLTAWNDLQIRVENIQMQPQMDKVRTRTQRSPIVDIVVASITAMVCGNFVADHFMALKESPIMALPVAVVFALAIATINLAVRQIILSQGLDYSRPIVETQTQLAKLRQLRVKATQWTFLLALPAWVIFPIFLAQLIISPKVVFAIDPEWIVANILFGLAMMPVIDWAMRKSRYAKSLQDSIAGKDIQEAEAFLEDLQTFRSA